MKSDRVKLKEFECFLIMKNKVVSFVFYKKKLVIPRKKTTLFGIILHSIHISLPLFFIDVMLKLCIISDREHSSSTPIT
jgi:hypothetical protein